MRDIFTFFFWLFFSIWIAQGLLDWYRTARDSSEKPNKIKGLLMVFAVIGLIVSLLYLIFSQNITMFIKIVLIFVSILLFGKVAQLVYKN